MNKYDVIIIGAGPAGVTAASILVANKMSVLLIEKGRDIARRRSPISGWFGQGFYLKKFPTEDRKLNDIKAFRNAIRIIKKVLQWSPPPKQKYAEPPNDAGPKLANYFFNIVVPKADVIFEAPVIKVIKIKREFEVTTLRGVFRAKRCVIATGSASYSWLKNICKNLNITCANRSARIGVRVEIPSSIADDISDDMPAGEINCTDICRNAIVTEWEESDILSASGCEIPEKATDKTNFMAGFEPKVDSEEIIRITKIANVLADDRVKRESIKDFIENRSVLQHLTMFDNFKESFEKIHENIPKFIDCGSIYVPEVKLNGILPVTAKMRTRMTKLYGAGECTTRVSTIVGAMASGLICAKTILEE